MVDVELSQHALAMLKERGITEDWMWRALHDPDRTESGTDGNIHHIKAISEHGGRWLRVVVNPHVQPKLVVTLFFDRRLRRNR